MDIRQHIIVDAVFASASRSHLEINPVPGNWTRSRTQVDVEQQSLDSEVTEEQATTTEENSTEEESTFIETMPPPPFPRYSNSFPVQRGEQYVYKSEHNRARFREFSNRMEESHLTFYVYHVEALHGHILAREKPVETTDEADSFRSNISRARIKQRQSLIMPREDAPVQKRIKDLLENIRRELTFCLGSQHNTPLQVRLFLLLQRIKKGIAAHSLCENLPPSISAEIESNLLMDIRKPWNRYAKICPAFGGLKMCVIDSEKKESLLNKFYSKREAADNSMIEIGVPGQSFRMMFGAGGRIKLVRKQKFGLNILTYVDPDDPKQLRTILGENASLVKITMLTEAEQGFLARTLYENGNSESKCNAIATFPTIEIMSMYEERSNKRPIPNVEPCDDSVPVGANLKYKEVEASIRFIWRSVFRPPLIVKLRSSHDFICAEEHFRDLGFAVSRDFKGEETLSLFIRMVSRRQLVSAKDVELWALSELSKINVEPQNVKVLCSRQHAFSKDEQDDTEQELLNLVNGVLSPTVEYVPYDPTGLTFRRHGSRKIIKSFWQRLPEETAFVVQVPENLIERLAVVCQRCLSTHNMTGSFLQITIRLTVPTQLYAMMRYGVELLAKDCIRVSTFDAWVRIGNFKVLTLRTCSIEVVGYPRAFVEENYALLCQLFKPSTFSSSEGEWLFCGIGAVILRSIIQAAPDVMVDVDVTRRAVRVFGMRIDKMHFIEKLQRIARKKHSFEVKERFSLGSPRFFDGFAELFCFVDHFYSSQKSKYGVDADIRHIFACPEEPMLRYEHTENTVIFCGTALHAEYFSSFLRQLDELVHEVLKDYLPVLDKTGKKAVSSAPHCAVCKWPVSDDFYCLEKCGHLVCRPCVNSQVIALHFECVLCQSPFDAYDIERLLLGHGNGFTSAHQLQFLSHIKLSDFVKPKRIEACKDSNSKFFACLTGECPNVFESSKCRPLSLYRKFRCELCNCEMCDACGFEPHDNIPCSQYQLSRNNPEASLAEYARKVGASRIGKCPNCGVSIEKTEGCNHVECASCHRHICFACRKFHAAASGDVYAHMTDVHGGSMGDTDTEEAQDYIFDESGALISAPLDDIEAQIIINMNFPL